MFSKGRTSITLNDILTKVSEGEILSHYLGITSIPTLINSPFRQDRHPSFGINILNGVIYYKDFSTKESGNLYTLLGKMWNMKYDEVINKIYNDLDHINTNISYRTTTYKRGIHSTNTSILKCKIREWKDYDIKYWESYGISLPWLKYADVYPISHKIVEKDNNTYVFGADKYAYAYVEFKEGNTTLKIYQPFNTNGYKWSNKHGSSVISLWTKIPEKGDRLCICSSLKDALCLWCNTGIPSIAPQGEGYSMSNTAITNLKQRYKNIYIIFDNDETGIKDSKLLSEQTGFTNIILPQGYGKDISDIYYNLKDKYKFIDFITKLF